MYDTQKKDDALNMVFSFYYCLSFSGSHFGLTTTGVFFLILIAIVLHILDRQGDFVARTDFLWKAKLKTEQEEVETMRGINKVTFFFLCMIFHFSTLTEYMRWWSGCRNACEGSDQLTSLKVWPIDVKAWATVKNEFNLIQFCSFFIALRVTMSCYE